MLFSVIIRKINVFITKRVLLQVHIHVFGYICESHLRRWLFWWSWRETEAILWWWTKTETISFCTRRYVHVHVCVCERERQEGWAMWSKHISLAGNQWEWVPLRSLVLLLLVLLGAKGLPGFVGQIVAFVWRLWHANDCTAVRQFGKKLFSRDAVVVSRFY